MSSPEISKQAVVQLVQRVTGKRFVQRTLKTRRRGVAHDRVIGITTHHHRLGLRIKLTNRLEGLASSQSTRNRQIQKDQIKTSIASLHVGRFEITQDAAVGFRLFGVRQGGMCANDTLRGPVRFPDELTIGYTKYINRLGGGVSWDALLTLQGHIDPEFLPQLTTMGAGCPER